MDINDGWLDSLRTRIRKLVASKVRRPRSTTMSRAVVKAMARGRRVKLANTVKSPAAAISHSLANFKDAHCFCTTEEYDSSDNEEWSWSSQSSDASNFTQTVYAAEGVKSNVNGSLSAVFKVKEYPGEESSSTIGSEFDEGNEFHNVMIAEPMPKGHDVRVFTAQNGSASRLEFKSLVCRFPGCGATFAKPQALSNHSRLHVPHDQRIKTEVLDVKPQTVSTTGSSKRKKKTNAFKTTPSKVSASSLVRKGEDYYPISYSETCADCKVTFTEPLLFRMHSPCREIQPDFCAVKLRRFKCPIEGCDERLPQADYIMKHVCKDHFPEKDLTFNCLHCSTRCLEEQDIIQHLVKVHRKSRKTCETTTSSTDHL